MHKNLTVEESLEDERVIFVDVRSPAEHERERIMGSVNLPLFDNEQRAMIGSAYKENSSKARQEGLRLAAARLPAIITEIENLSKKGKPVLYCWRGGLRSKSILAVTEIMELPVYRLGGGYKAYRRFILKQLQAYALHMPVYVLNGLTGAGKTEVLRLLARQGQPVLDLEGLAGHRGSLFGHLGLEGKQSQKNFDALLWSCLEELKHADYLLVEGEGKRIGSVYQPGFLFQALEKGEHILLTAPLAVRVNRLLKEYTPSSPADLEEVGRSIQALKKYLGTKKVNTLLALLKQNDFETLVSQLCQLYYDRLYPESRPELGSFVLTVDSSDAQLAAKQIQSFVTHRYNE